MLGPILEKVKPYKLNIDNYKNCVVNLTKPLDVNFIHTHPYTHLGCLTCELGSTLQCSVCVNRPLLTLCLGSSSSPVNDG